MLRRVPVVYMAFDVFICRWRVADRKAVGRKKKNFGSKLRVSAERWLYHRAQYGYRKPAGRLVFEPTVFESTTWHNTGTPRVASLLLTSPRLALSSAL